MASKCHADRRGWRPDCRNRTTAWKFTAKDPIPVGRRLSSLPPPSLVSLEVFFPLRAVTRKVPNRKWNPLFSSSPVMVMTQRIKAVASWIHDISIGGQNLPVRLQRSALSYPMMSRRGRSRRPSRARDSWYLRRSSPCNPQRSASFRSRPERKLMWARKR